MNPNQFTIILFRVASFLFKVFKAAVPPPRFFIDCIRDKSILPLIPPAVGLFFFIRFMFFLPYREPFLGRLFMGLFEFAIPFFLLHFILKYFYPKDPANYYGSASFASASDMKRLGHLFKAENVPSEPGLVLGLEPKSGRAFDPRFRYRGHLLTCAPTGSGKGVSAIIPNLLEYPGSVFVLDVKGENVAVTQNARRLMGQTVYCFDPFNVTKSPSHKINLLSQLTPENPDAISDAASLAEMCIVRSKNTDTYWDDAAKDLLRGLILYTALLRENHMRTLRNLLTQPMPDFKKTLEEMQHMDIFHGVIKKAANTFLAKAEKDQSGVLSSAIRHTSFLDDPRISEALSKDEIPIASLKEMPMSVYLVMPPDKVATYNRVLRCFLGLALSGITRSSFRPPHKALFVLDEFAQLGYMASIEDGIAIVRGYGASFWILLQDLSQIKALYPKWQTILANSAKQFFGTADIDTAKYISASLGTMTHHYKNTSESTSSFSSNPSSTSDVYHARALLTPDEVMRLGDRLLVLIQNEKPYYLRKLNYLYMPYYLQKADPNPYYAEPSTTGERKAS